MYIKDVRCISPQQSYDSLELPKEINAFEGNRYPADEPDYVNMIPLAQLRRMGKAVRMGIGAGLPLVGTYKLDGIVIGTAFGGLEDCAKFLNQIVDYDEGSLTPTQFVQSTPNAVAGTLGLMSKNRGYNATHVNDGHSFENALIDTQMLLDENPGNAYLVGGIEELSDYNYNIDDLAGLFKKNPVPSEKLISSGTVGTVAGEGAAMFVATNEPDNALFKVVSIELCNFPSKEDVDLRLDRLFQKRDYGKQTVDSLIIGKNGDSRGDDYYDFMMNDVFPDTSVYTFKNLSGEYSTSTSFALWYAASLLNGKNPSKATVLRNKERIPKRVLIYNQYKNRQHSFILLESTEL